MYDKTHIKIYQKLSQTSKMGLKRWLLAQLKTKRTPRTFGNWFNDVDEIPVKVDNFSTDEIKIIMLQGLTMFAEAEKNKFQSIMEDAKKEVLTFNKYLKKLMMFN